MPGFRFRSGIILLSAEGIGTKGATFILIALSDADCRQELRSEALIMASIVELQTNNDDTKSVPMSRKPEKTRGDGTVRKILTYERPSYYSRRR